MSQESRRHHLLSSINPEAFIKPPKERPSACSTECLDEGKQDHGAKLRETEPPSKCLESKEQSGDDSRPHKRTRLKLKDSSRTETRSNRQSHRHRHRSHRHHEHRSHRSPTPPNPYEPEPLDPEAAFRESLFDAMADDEGAAHWQAVYGQPVHVYSNEKTGPDGELERMTDEEYASHVRQKMWAKTNAGLLEERAKRQEAKKRKEKEQQQERELHADMERSLRRGEERRQRKAWDERWKAYTEAWKAWEGDAVAMPWPNLEARRRGDLDQKDVRRFFVYGLGLERTGEKTFASRLKEERIRWHPDKVQQRLGGQVDPATMRDVTAVFQIIDRLWSEVKA